MTEIVTTQPQAILAFDRLAEDYDELFTKSLIGRAQRNAVWNVMVKTFRSGDHVLELNCGTGEDAFFLARNGVSVVACDASERMIQIARQRLCTESLDIPVHFEQLPTEQIQELQSTTAFDGAFSNFSGLNCVADLRQTAEKLADLIPAGAPLLICLSTRFCISEMIWFLLHGQLRKAFRRCSGQTTAKINEFTVAVHYPTVSQLQDFFFPTFVMRTCTGIGIAVPPSYVEPWIRKYPKLLNLLCTVDKIISTCPGIRVLGDHMLLCFERVQV
jgi:SAM-dependent methyltransferase